MDEYNIFTTPTRDLTPEQLADTVDVLRGVVTDHKAEIIRLKSRWEKQWSAAARQIRAILEPKGDL